MAEEVPGWLGRILLPQVGELKGELKAISARLDGITARLDGEFKAVNWGIRRLDERIDGLAREWTWCNGSPWWKGKSGNWNPDAEMAFG